MPDVSGSEVLTWYDELCMSCLGKEGCLFIEAIKANEIVFFTGCKVWKCKEYVPDEASPHYMPPEQRYPTEYAQKDLQEAVAELDRTLEDSPWPTLS